MGRSVLATLLALTAFSAPSAASGHTVGCPEGQAIRGINFVTHRLVCVSVGAEEIAALQGRVAALEAANVLQAAAIASLQGELDQLQAQIAPLLAGTLASPDGQYVVTVANDGITLAGPGARIGLNANNPGAAPTVEVAATDVVVIADRNTGIASGIATSISSDANTSIASGVATSVTSAAGTSLQGSPIRLNGGCAGVARVGDFVVQVGPLFQIDTGSPTVLSC
jgi:hypothetical protein